MMGWRAIIVGARMATSVTAPHDYIHVQEIYQQLQYRMTHGSPTLQAGHNKWSKIKRPKAIADLKRSKLFTKYITQIMSSVRVDGGPNPQSNNRLSHLITQAKEAGVSKANIESAIHRANVTKQECGELVLYEARGKGGYSLLIEVLTEDRKKTRPVLRHFLSKNGCILGELGSSSFNFDYKGIVRVPCKELLASQTDPMELAIEVGAEDVTSDNPNATENEGEISVDPSPDALQVEHTPHGDECFQFKCEPRDLKTISDAVRGLSFSISSASLEYIPKSYVFLKQRDFDKAVALVSLLSERDEVMEVYDDFTLNQEG